METTIELLGSAAPEIFVVPQQTCEVRFFGFEKRAKDMSTTCSRSPNAPRGVCNLITRAERVTQHRTEILSHYDPNLQSFIDFVLSQYITQGVTELDENKLSDLLALRYHTLYDATATLGAVPPIRTAFTSFQPHLFRAPTPNHPIQPAAT